MWELCTLARQPYQEVVNDDMEQFLSEGYRLAQPVNCPDELFAIMAYCTYIYIFPYVYTLWVLRQESNVKIWLNILNSRLGTLTFRKTLIWTTSSLPARFSQSTHSIYLNLVFNFVVILIVNRKCFVVIVLISSLKCVLWKAIVRKTCTPIEWFPQLVNMVLRIHLK